MLAWFLSRFVPYHVTHIMLHISCYSHAEPSSAWFQQQLIAFNPKDSAGYLLSCGRTGTSPYCRARYPPTPVQGLTMAGASSWRFEFPQNWPHTPGSTMLHLSLSTCRNFQISAIPQRQQQWMTHLKDGYFGFDLPCGSASGGEPFIGWKVSSPAF